MKQMTMMLNKLIVKIKNFFNKKNIVVISKKIKIIISNSGREFVESLNTLIGNKFNSLYLLFYILGVIYIFISKILKLQESFFFIIISNSLSLIFIAIISYCIYEVIEDYVFKHFIRYIFKKLSIVI